jgi:hypothetical protein
LPYTHEQWESKIPFENARDWEEVQSRLRSLDFASFYSTTYDDQMEVIKRQLAETKRARQEEKIRAKEIRLKEEAELKAREEQERRLQQHEELRKKTEEEIRRRKAKEDAKLLEAKRIVANMRLEKRL